MNNLITQPQVATAYFDNLKASEKARLIDPAIVKELLETKPIVRAVGYNRVSTPGQAKEDKVSLPEQKRRIGEEIASYEWKQVDFYEEGYGSGTSLDDRSQFQRMIEDAKQGKFDVIVGWATDRLARTKDDMTLLRMDLRKYKVQITTVQEHLPIMDPRLFTIRKSDDNGLMQTIYDWNAEQDNKKRTDRFELGKMGKARKGKIPCKPPYGYQKYVQYDAKGRRAEEDIVVPEKEAIVRTIFDRYDQENVGMRKIAEDLNLAGHASPSGGKWCYSSVKYILQNPTYTGAVRYGWRLSKSKDSRARLSLGHEGYIGQGQHKAIITPEQFQRVQHKLALRKKLGGRAVSSRGLLVGIAKCGRCGGGTFVTQYPHWHAYKQDKKDREKYKNSKMYMCSSYSSKGKSGCSKRWVMYQNKLERIVVNKIKELANSETSRRAYLEEMKNDGSKTIQQEVKRLVETRERLEAKRERIKDAYYNKATTLEEFTSDTNNIRSDLAKVEEQIATRQAELASLQHSSAKAIEIHAVLEHFEENWEKADFQLKRELMQSILERVIVNNNKVEVMFRVGTRSGNQAIMKNIDN